MSEFLTVYPGVYLPEELQALGGIKESIARGLARGDMSFEELVATSDGRDRGYAFRVTATPEEVQARMRTMDPENPMWFEPTAPGEKLPVPETWACPNGGFFGGMNRSFGDRTCVKEHHHYCRFLKPVYQGDTLYLVLKDQQVWDATPYEGSEFRTWALRGTGFVYNQKGELVMIQTCGVEECFQIFADPTKRTWSAENLGVSEPEFANHAIHHYTDEDWEYIQNLWAMEELRGDAPLYWEDVLVGDRPPITADGPYTCPGKGGMVMSVNTPSRSDWYVRGHFGDPVLERDAFGVYIHPELFAAEGKERQEAMAEMMRRAPHPPEPGKKEPGKPGEPKKPEKPPLNNSPVAVRGKATFDNFTGRNAALRCIHNWIGNQGKITAISWCIGSHADFDRGIPCHPNRKNPFDAVPGMEGRHNEVHGEEGDMSITHMVVTGKRIDEENNHLVDITWWCETIEHQIHTEGTATVCLPSKT